MDGTEDSYEVSDDCSRETRLVLDFTPVDSDCETLRQRSMTLWNLVDEEMSWWTPVLKEDSVEKVPEADVVPARRQPTAVAMLDFVKQSAAAGMTVSGLRDLIICHTRAVTGLYDLAHTRMHRSCAAERCEDSGAAPGGGTAAAQTKKMEPNASVDAKLLQDLKKWDKLHRQL